MARAWNCDWLALSRLERDQPIALEPGLDLAALTARSLETVRGLAEERRVELTVLPEGFPPVRPPIYFGGDLMGRGPWRQYWSTIESRAHHVRESLA